MPQSNPHAGGIPLWGARVRVLAGCSCGEHRAPRPPWCCFSVHLLTSAPGCTDVLDGGREERRQPVSPCSEGVFAPLCTNPEILLNGAEANSTGVEVAWGGYGYEGTPVGRAHWCSGHRIPGNVGRRESKEGLVSTDRLVSRWPADFDGLVRRFLALLQVRRRLRGPPQTCGMRGVRARRQRYRYRFPPSEIQGQPIAPRHDASGCTIGTWPPIAILRMFAPASAPRSNGFTENA